MNVSFIIEIRISIINDTFIVIIVVTDHIYWILIVAGPWILFIHAKRALGYFAILPSSYSDRGSHPSLSTKSTAQNVHWPEPPQLPSFFFNPLYNSILFSNSFLRRLSPTFASITDSLLSSKTFINTSVPTS